MPSNYQAITKHNEEWLGRDTASRKTQISMYSDSTHFIYEILQNADDYGAKDVFFKLSEAELWIEHDGEPFTKDNVEAITYFGQSTSREDLVKTGRFGVGFKSVFAFTATPIIISDCEHFKIHGLYCVKEYPYPDDLPRPRTRIILPFNHESENPDYVENLMSRADAYSKIEERLTSLNKNTLLFTQNIREVRWETNDGSGYYSREDDISNNARMTTITDGEHVKKYLVFSRKPRWKDEVHKTVDVAFGIDEKGEIVPVPAEEGFLYVLFSTERETRLRFILNGPYRTNPARETIPEDDHFNRHLIKETCDLVEDILPQIRKKELLTTKFLAVLPNEYDELRDFYKPIMDRLVELFNNEKLTPMKRGGHAAAKGTFKGSAKLSDLIDDKDLARILGDGHFSPLWIKNPQSGSQADRFLSMLEIKEWITQDLINKLSEQSEMIMKWLARKNYDWHRRLYVLLLDELNELNKSLERTYWYEDSVKQKRKDKLLNLCIIRCSDKKYRKGKDCFFPSDGVKDDEFPHIAKRLYSSCKDDNQRDRVCEFLEKIEVSEVEESHRIKEILKKRYSKGSIESDPQDLERFIAFVEKEPDKDYMFKEYYIFELGRQDRRWWEKPKIVFLDSPYLDTGLKAYYEALDDDTDRKWALSPNYKESGIDLKKIGEFAKKVGAQTELEVKEQKIPYRHPKRNHLLSAPGERKRNEINLDYTIPAFEVLFDKPNLNKAQLIWRTMDSLSSKYLTARYRKSESGGFHYAASSLVYDLRNAEWVPQEHGESLRFVHPCDASADHLPEGFPYESRREWIRKIEFGKRRLDQEDQERIEKERATREYQETEKVARNCGLDSGDQLKELGRLNRENPEAMQEFLQQPAPSSRTAGAFSSENPEAMQEFLQQQETKKQEKTSNNSDSRKEKIPFHKALSEAFVAPSKDTVDNDTGYGGSIQNPSRRRDRTSESIAADIENEGKQGVRSYFSTVKKWKGKNDQVRVNLTEWYDGQCQICDKTFTQSNGEPYFEGLYLVSHTTAEWIDRVGNVLCLCPWHSAMFQFGPKEIDEGIIQQILRLKVQAEGGEGQLAIELRLCEEDVKVKFAERHLIDLQEMIKKSQELENLLAD